MDNNLKLHCINVCYCNKQLNGLAKIESMLLCLLYDSSDHCLFHFPGSSTFLKPIWLKIEQICLLIQHSKCC